MRILITNAYADTYTGTEVVVRDLALELRRQGHEPLIYSPRVGALAEEIRSSGVVVTDQLSVVAAPDIIHGQHQAAMEALLHFPSVPAIFVCHGATEYQELPFYFPRILRYVAVDDRCKRRIESVPGIAAGRIEVIWNAVDLSRFRQRRPLPAKPERALVFSSPNGPATHLPAIRTACRQTRLELDVIGSRSGNSMARPEEVLPNYDIVFAKARCALEAMAAGSAVVLCDSMGLGAMVSSRNFDSLRPMNFGAGLLVNPLRSELIREEIQRYDAGDAGAVCRRVRDEAGLAEATRRWVRLYSDVIEEFRGSDRKVDDEFRALAGYVKSWNHGKRVWGREQLQRLGSVPVIGRPLAYLARRVLRKWTDRWGLPYA